MKKHLRRLPVLALALLPFTKTFANRLTVCTSGCGFSTVAGAVAAANSGDTILLKGTITESGITISKNLVLIGEGMASTFVQGSETRGTALHRVFSINSGVSVTVKDLTVQNGREGMPDPANANASGGGFLVDGTNTTLTLINVCVRNNDNGYSSGGAGGAIGLFGNATSLQLYNSRVEGNASPGSAGALYLTATNGVINAKNTVFDNNYAASGSGGAIFLGGTISASFSNCTFSNNKANTSSGGAVYGNSSLPEFTNCTFYGNVASSQGGALRIGPATLTNCTFYQNTADMQGGAIYRGGTNASPLSVVNCTIYSNTGSVGGGLCYNTTSGNVNLVNSVLANNTGGDLFAANATNFSVNQKNYVASSGFDYGTTTFAYSSGSLNISTPLANEGGLTPILSVGAGSVLINNGTSSASGVTILQKDQRNYNRFGSIDIGAYETAGSESLAINYVPLANTTVTNGRTLRTTIADEVNGVPTSGSYVPRLYYKKNDGNWVSTAGTLAAGNTNSGTWDFTIDHSLVGGVTNGDAISYFVTAQDNGSGSFAKSNLNGLVAADVLTVSATPSPDVYTVNSSTLPIKLISFDATRQDVNSALLTWKVVEDDDADSYEVLRSSGNAGFKTMATVPAKGLSAYSYPDKNVTGTVHYQLKTLTKTGEVNYSKVVSVTFANTASVQLIPNFVTSDHAVLSINLRSATQAAYTVVDMSGREVLKKTIPVTAGANSIALPLAQVSRGQYFLQISLGLDVPQTIPFIKN